VRAQSVEGVFGRSWQLLTRNWVLIVPGLIIGVIVGLAQAVFGAPGDDSSGGSLAGAVGAFVANIVVTVIALLGAIANTAYTTGMAGVAWERGTTTLADGRRAFERDAGHIFVAMIGLFVLGIVAAILAIPTLGLALLAYVLLFIYTMPAAVVGERRGIDALAESYRMATKRFWTTLIVVVLIGVIAVGAWFIIAALHFAPFIGPLVGAIIDQMAVAYFTLVVVGEYLNLRAAAEPPPTFHP
jgi:hypothetical protein